MAEDDSGILDMLLLPPSLQQAALASMLRALRLGPERGLEALVEGGEAADGGGGRRWVMAGLQTALLLLRQLLPPLQSSLSVQHSLEKDT